MPKTTPDRAALEAAYQRLAVKTMTLDDMLASATLRPVLENAARSHIKKQAQRTRFDPRAARCGNDQ